ncbi:hypothetical protein Nepgr_010433 [Nepenthes gracilis]|uniref:Uncharacterized protein n=1 Tax=Nepenthes gracilis TaxID=150966 RepID=A0AAD3XL13_NEPGR|nr:hypothetical protein Nepgr_010433 [Nepenthes gracilis]
MAALYLTTMLLVLPVDGVGVGYYWALFGRVCLIFLMLVNQCAAVGDGKWYPRNEGFAACAGAVAQD